MKRSLFCPADTVIILIAAAAAILLTVQFSRGETSRVVIAQDGQTVYSEPLSKDAEYVCGGVTVTVKDRTAYVSDSDCKDKICMRTRLKKSGDCAVCLPNRVTVTVSGEPAADGVTY
jgi:hypothetical protein